MGQFLNKCSFVLLCILAFLTPITYWPIHGWLAFPFYDTCFGLLAASFLLRLLFSEVVLSKPGIKDYCFYLFLIIIAINGLIVGSWSSAEQQIEMLMLFYIVVNGRYSRCQLETVISILVGAGLIVALIGLYSYLYDNRNFVASTFSNPNLLSGYLSLLLPVSLAIWFVPGIRKKLFSLISTVVLGFVMATTLTRAGYISSIAGMTGLLLIKGRKLLIVLAIYIFILGALVSPATTRISEIKDLSNVHTYSTQIQQSKDASSVSSVDSRLRLWSFALKEFNRKPIMGIGLGNFQASLREYINIHPEANQFFIFGIEDVHNSYLRFLVETGILGFTIFFLFLLVWIIPLIKYLWTTRKACEPLEIGILFGIFAFLLHNLTNSLLFRIPTSYTFWVCLAIITRFIALKTPEEVETLKI